MKKYNIKDGKISLQMYIDLREALQRYAKHSDIYTLYKDILFITQGKEYSVTNLREREVYLFVEGVIKDLTFWAEVEKKTLAYTPTSKELQAGYNDYVEKTGWTSLIASLCKDYKVRPNVLLEEWTWAECYTLIFADHCRNEYENKLQKIYMKR